jgi:hypothetical protein
MIQQGQKRIHDPNIQFVQGRYEDLRTELVGRAGLVTIAANTYMMMLNKADRLRTLAVAKKYLTTNGRIYIDIRNGGASSVFERERQLDLPDGQHLKFHIKWKETPGLRIYELTFTKGIQKQRFTFPTATMSFEAARAEFNEAGLEVEDSFGDYDHSPVTDQSVNWFFVLKLATR